MSVAAIAWARAQKAGCPIAKAVLMELADAADMDGFVEISVARIARWTEVHEDDLSPALQRLVSLGLLEKHGETARLAIQREPDVYTPRPAGWGALRARVLRRDGHACTYCGSMAQPLHCDHVIPRSRGGSDDEGNLTTACGPCNSSKRDRGIGEWRGRVLSGDTEQ